MSHKRNEALRHVQHSMHHVIAAGEGSDRAPDSCKLCPYYRPDFKFRTCLYAHCPYKKQVNVFRSTPEKWDILYGDIMKKIMAVMLSLLACTVLLAGCNTSSESNEEQSLKVYSFSGENEYISVSNGVIILDGKDEICYGGDLKVMSDDFANITTYSTTIYINGSEKETLLSNGVDDQTGETIDVSGNVGQISGDILRDSDADKLTDNLWFEYK